MEAPLQMPRQTFESPLRVRHRAHAGIPCSTRSPLHPSPSYFFPDSAATPNPPGVFGLPEAQPLDCVQPILAGGGPPPQRRSSSSKLESLSTWPQPTSGSGPGCDLPQLPSLNDLHASPDYLKNSPCTRPKP